MKQAAFEQVEEYMLALPWHSGDAMLTETLWHVMGIAPTDPGMPLVSPLFCQMAVSCGSKTSAQHAGGFIVII